MKDGNVMIFAINHQKLLKKIPAAKIISDKRLRKSM
jgi:hypothetical protein